MKKIVFGLLILFLQSTAIAADKLTVLLDWFANPSHAPLFVAQQQGYFAAENLDVKLIGPADPSDPPKLVAAGKADIAIDYEPQYMEQVDRGLPLISIGSLIDHPLNCLTVLKDGSIKSIKDLNGKRIGHSSGSMSSVMLNTMLTANHVPLNNVENINVRYDLSQALLSHKVDAVTGMMRTFEVIQMELAGHPVRIFLPEQNGMPNYSELIFVINNQHTHDPRLPRFMAAVQKGANYLQKHPEETWKAFAKAHPELNNELNHRAWFATLPYFAKNPVKFDTREWEKFAAFMQQNSLIKKALPIQNYTATIE